MRVLTVPQPMASLAGLGLLRFVPVPEPTAYRGEVAIVGTPGFDWRPQTEALNERWDRLGTPVELDEAEPRLAFRDDTIETGFEPGAWTSRNTKWVSAIDARILAGALVVDCLPVFRHDDPAGRECVVAHDGESLDHVIPVDPNGDDPYLEASKLRLIRDISDQAAYADFTGTPWVLLLECAQWCTDRCPNCWGEGSFPWQNPCLYCDGDRAVCEEVPFVPAPGQLLDTWRP